MKRLIITSCIVLTMCVIVFGLDLSNSGQYRLWKEGENHVKVQRTITDPNGILTVVWERSYGLAQVMDKLKAAQAEVIFFDMDSDEAFAYVANRKAAAIVKRNRWLKIKNKFTGPIDTE